jgi:hypothetical protein
MGRMTTRILLAVLTASAALAVAACGGDDPTSSGASGDGKGVDAKTKQAMLDFAKCMREHGVDMPDPKFGEGGGVSMVRKKGTDPETDRKAEQACKHFQDEIKPPPASEEEKAESKKRALANAKCMREHGIANFPDPQFDESGRVTLRLDRKAGVDPEDPKFQAAQKACAKQTGMGMITGGSKP